MPALRRGDSVAKSTRAQDKIAVHTWRDLPITRFAHRALWSNSNQKFFNYGNNVPPRRVPGRALDMAHWQNPFSASHRAMVL